MDQDAEVAQLLGDLVGGRDQPGDHPQADVGDEGGPNGQPADEVVEPVADQDQIPQGPVGAGGRWQWCQCRYCSNSKKLARPAASQP